MFSFNEIGSIDGQLVEPRSSFEVGSEIEVAGRRPFRDPIRPGEVRRQLNDLDARIEVLFDVGPEVQYSAGREPRFDHANDVGPNDSAFAMPDGVEKVAHLVKFFIERGGHQMQINTINRETLLDAQAHPERHRHLIVRVWGWSGYFIELDKEYQNQIIKRVELK